MGEAPRRDGELIALLDRQRIRMDGDPDNRPADIFSGTVTLHTGPKYPSHLLVPFIPS